MPRHPMGERAMTRAERQRLRWRRNLVRLARVPELANPAVKAACTAYMESLTPKQLDEHRRSDLCYACAERLVSRRGLGMSSDMRDEIVFATRMVLIALTKLGIQHGNTVQPADGQPLVAKA